MSYHAGLIGYSASALPPARLTEALRRSPWRGELTTTLTGPGGTIHALGAAAAGRFEHVGVVLHGRLDNLEALASDLNVDPQDPARVIAAAYLRHGHEFATHLLGDFAALVLDDDRATLLGVRDWIGARPIFWGHDDSNAVFGSEPKQVLALLDKPCQVDADALSLYANADWDQLGLGTMFLLGVAPVLPNGQVVIGQGQTPRSWRRALRFEPVELSLSEAAEAVRNGLERAVRRRVSDASHLGALVSGGMDSSSVMAMAASLSGRGSAPTVRNAFTITYPDVRQSDESSYASEVASHWEIPWTAVPVRPADLLDGLPALLVLHDGPTFPGYAPNSNLLMPAVEQAGVDVLLTGQGADAWLGAEDAALTHALLRRDFRSFAEWELAHIKWSIQLLLQRRRPRTGIRQVLDGVRGLANHDRAEAYFEHVACDYWGRVAFESEERDGMRHGIRAEFPFADQELAALLAGLAPGIRATPVLSKRVMREAMRGLLPDSVRLRTDVTFADAVIRRAVGRYDGNWRPSVELARRYAAAWENHCH